MIVYGTRAKEMAKELLTDKCPNCGTQNAVTLHVFQRYAHVFWIPFFPVGKTGVSQCEHCKQVLKLKEMPPNFKASYDDLKLHVKPQVWMFSGIAVLAVAITAGVIADRKRSDDTAKFVLAPQKGDVAEIKIEDKQYSIIKVEGVTKDNVFIRQNKYQTDLSSGIDGLKRKGDTAYVDEVDTLPLSAFKMMFDKGELLNIERK